MRNAPPISISFARGDHNRLAPMGETVSTRRTAAALLFTTRVFGAGEAREEALFTMIVALATLARRQVEFEGDGLAHGYRRRLRRRFGKNGAAKIRMEHCAPLN